MIQSNNNLSVLPFYTNVNWQNAKKSYAYGDVYPLATPMRHILPFQVIRATRSAPILAVRLFNDKGQQIADITQQMLETGLSVQRFAAYGFDLFVYNGLLPLSFQAEQGRHYIQISDGVQGFTSDIFTWTPDVSGFMRLQWWDAETLQFPSGAIFYDGLFKNTLFICAELGKPDYTFEEEGESRDGYFFPEKQVSYKTYRTIFLAPEYLCDVMRVIRMSDYVTVDIDGQHYECDTFLITPKWQTQGNLASVEIEFTTDTVIKKIGRGFMPTYKGDYNKDFNTDFNNND